MAIMGFMAAQLIATTLRGSAESAGQIKDLTEATSALEECIAYLNTEAMQQKAASDLITDKGLEALLEAQDKRELWHPDGCPSCPDNLLITVERRLDNVVYRMGFAMTRRQARQLVSHAHFTVNGKKVNIPSYLVKAGDVIEVAESSRSSEVFKRLTGQDAPMFLLPAWMEREKNTLKGTVIRLPAREDIDVPVEEHLIVELYSK